MKMCRWSVWSSLALTFTLLCTLPLRAETPMIILRDTGQGEEPEEKLQVIWATDPGIRYELQESDDLEHWTTVEGFPTEAQALAQQFIIEREFAGTRRFFRVRMLDEQPPAITRRNPARDAFGVRRFSALTIDLDDVTGVDPDSILLTVGSHGTFSLADDELSYEDGTLVFDLGGDTALGGWGETIEISLTVADVLGNEETKVWSFELEKEVEVAENIFVFGSPDAQRAGQQLSGPAAALATRFGGPVRMSDSGQEWEIASVSETSITISYTGGAPDFSEGQLVTNMAPAHTSQIFYRVVDTMEDDPDAATLTLYTTELTLPDFIHEGSFSIDDNAVFLEMDEDGNLVRALEIDATFHLPTIGTDLTGMTLFETGPLTMTMEEGKFQFHPYLRTSLDIGFTGVRRFEAQAAGNLEIACVPRVGLTAGYKGDLTRELWGWSHWIWTSAGFIPVGIELKASITASATIDLAAAAHVQAGFRQNANMGIAGRYVRDAVPAVSWDRWFNFEPLEVVPLTYSLDGEGGVTLALIPQIDVRVYGAAGLYLNVDPRVELNGHVTMSGGTIMEAGWTLGAYADINAGLSVVGFETGTLPSLPPFRLFTREWTESYVSEPLPATPLEITRQPISQTARAGDSVTFSVEATGDGPLTYQWYHNGLQRPGATGRHLVLNNVTGGHEGSYHVRVRDAHQATRNSSTANLALVTGGSTGAIAGGMVLIPGGTNAGTDPDFGAYVLTVTSFYMDRYEVTKALWDEVYQWAVTHGGYSFDHAGRGKAANHPVRTVNWYDVVKWCNARSEKEGRMAVYAVDGTVYRTGRSNNVAAGYRLPTDVEWEYAARGGLESKRFPWGDTDTIQHARANYNCQISYSYDTSPTRGYHPTYNDGVWPYTSPVGSFAPNGYGLYDMAGNVWEWCFTPSGSYRVSRGGGWSHDAYRCRVAFRLNDYPGRAHDFIGFRAVLPPGQ